MAVSPRESRSASERVCWRRRYRRRAMSAVLAALIALLLSSCGDGNREQRPSEAPSPARSQKFSGSLLPPGSGPVAPPVSQYGRVLHPYWLFLGFERGLIAQNWQISLCMRARGWDRYPLLKALSSAGAPQLDLIQTVHERRQVAMTYGAQIVSPRATGPDYFQRVRRFSDWLGQQPHAVRAKFTKDLSGGRSENEAPANGSCKARALERILPRIPSLDPTVEVRAGRLYDRYITRTSAHRQATQSWRRCMVEHGFTHVGLPLKVWHPGLDERLQRLPTLTEARKARLARALTRQAVAEHECALNTLDAVVRTGELRVVHALEQAFPQYAKPSRDKRQPGA